MPDITSRHGAYVHGGAQGRPVTCKKRPRHAKGRCGRAEGFDGERCWYGVRLHRAERQHPRIAGRKHCGRGRSDARGGARCHDGKQSTAWTGRPADAMTNVWT